ncbi:MAG: hypothetical protein C0517_05420 [Erythrobacter sp.]|nr:hypothetical protein [Erythrobacter sp.]
MECLKLFYEALTYPTETYCFPSAFLKIPNCHRETTMHWAAAHAHLKIFKNDLITFHSHFAVGDQVTQIGTLIESHKKTFGRVAIRLEWGLRENLAKICQ